MSEEIKIKWSKIVISVVAVSFLAGGAAGGVVGFFASNFWQDNIWTTFSQSPALSWFWGLDSHGKQAGPQAQGDMRENSGQKGNIEKRRVVEEESAAISAVEKVAPSVVSIIITKDLSKIYQQRRPFSPFDDFFNFGFPFGYGFEQSPPPQGKRQIGGGTGFVVDADKGFILTNKHVVSDEEAEYSVLTNTGEEYSAQVIARDPFMDIAMVQVKGLKGVPAVELGDSDQLKLGQAVIAIGNALGEYRNTVTRGVISGIGRDIVAGGAGQPERLKGVIQTDAAINPGNSGGPLIDLSGRVIGVNTAISREGQLIGFAIPINPVKRTITSVEEHGKIVRPFLGVRYILLNKAIAERNKLPVDYGALLVRGNDPTELAVVPGGPADKAGLEENDIILELNGVRIDEKNTLAELIQQYQTGDTVTLKIWHDGEEKEVSVTLGDMEG